MNKVDTSMNPGTLGVTMKIHAFSPSKVDYDLCKVCYEPEDAHPDAEEIAAAQQQRVPAHLYYQSPVTA